MDWLEKMNDAMDYIESHLADKISYDIVARNACCSTYHFLRMFPFITNVSLAEYIRFRRLTLAGTELLTTDIKVIDVALKYGYESPEAFSRAFKNFHGVTPISARDKNVTLKTYPRMTFQKNLKILEDFMEKAGMGKLTGVRVFEIPKFKAVSSGLDTFDSIFSEKGFEKWLLRDHKQLIKKTYEAPDFMWQEEDKSIWIWAVEDWVTETDTSPYELIEFEGGIYVAAVADENDGADLGEVYNHMVQWIKNSNVFETDDRPGHRIMFHRIGTGKIQEVLGMAQQEIFLPVKLKKQ